MNSKEATRERLLKAAEQVFADKGFYETAVDEVARLSNTSKGSVYFHFPSKEILFNAVMENLGERLLQRVEDALSAVEDPVVRLEVALQTTVETFCRHRTLARVLLVRGYSMGAGFTLKKQEIFSRFVTLIQQLLDEAVKVCGSSDFDTRVAASVWLGSITEVLIQWLEAGGPHPVADAMPTLRLLLLRSVGLEPTFETLKASTHG
jgi:AcrR family transcriptional regulator